MPQQTSQLDVRDPYAELQQKGPDSSGPLVDPADPVYLMRLFNHSAKGMDVVNEETTSFIAGAKVQIVKTDSTLPDIDLKPDREVVSHALYADFIHQDLENPDHSELDQVIEKVAQDTKLNPGLLRDTYNEVATQNRNELDTPSLHFDNAAKPSALSDEINNLIRRSVFKAPLDAEQKQDLADDLVVYGAQNHYAPGVAEDIADKFKFSLFKAADKQSDFAADEFLGLAADYRNSRGFALPFDSGKTFIALPGKGLETLFSDQDQSPVKNPATPETMQFLVGVHEAKHKTSGLPESTEAETQSDAAVISVLNNMIDEERHTHETYAQNIKDYWLRARNITALQAEVMYGDGSHDTATFIRYNEATGQKLDYDAFIKEKLDLAHKIADKLDQDKYAKDGIVKNSDIMGALKDVLDDHDLSPAQQAQAQSYLDDAKALGFKANADYAHKPDPTIPLETVPELPLVSRPLPGAAPGA